MRHLGVLRLNYTNGQPPPHPNTWRTACGQIRTTETADWSDLISCPKCQVMVDEALEDGATTEQQLHVVILHNQESA